MNDPLLPLWLPSGSAQISKMRSHNKLYYVAQNTVLSLVFQHFWELTLKLRSSRNGGPVNKSLVIADIKHRHYLWQERLGRLSFQKRFYCVSVYRDSTLCQNLYKPLINYLDAPSEWSGECRWMVYPDGEVSHEKCKGLDTGVYFMRISSTRKMNTFIKLQAWALQTHQPIPMVVRSRCHASHTATTTSKAMTDKLISRVSQQ